MWAQSTELKGAVGSGEVGEDRAQGVFPMAAKGKDNGAELSREGRCAGCEGWKCVCRLVRTEWQALRDLPKVHDSRSVQRVSSV